jgi:hypothetical protein
MNSEAKDSASNADRLVYIRALGPGEASRLLPPDAINDLDMDEPLFVVTSAEGTNLAIVEGKAAAWAAALAHDLRPVSVH